MFGSISKKELLQITGISYGQLYRWKREKLIPEEWFMKQSAFTGQETFFPRDKILKRIELIQKLKDSYSLEELARLLSPELTDRMFQLEDMQRMEEVDREVLQIFRLVLGKHSFSYMEVLFMYALSILKRESAVDEDSIRLLAEGMKDWFEKMTGSLYQFLVLRSDDRFFAVLHPAAAQTLLDGRFSVVRSFSMDELSNQLKMKYAKTFYGDVEMDRNTSSHKILLNEF